jgi:AraC-like DNA-binding protein
MLAHTDRRVASIAAELGLSEATNFTTFFVRMDGGRPGRWRTGAGGATAASAELAQRS